MDIASHCVDVSIDCKHCGVMWATWNLFDEGGKGKWFGDCEGFVMIFLAYSCLTVFIQAQE